MSKHFEITDPQKREKAILLVVESQPKLIAKILNLIVEEVALVDEGVALQFIPLVQERVKVWAEENKIKPPPSMYKE